MIISQNFQKNKPTVVAAYVRTSSNKQIDNSSIDIQIQTIRQYVESKGFLLPDELIFIDEATSAYRTSAKNRKALLKLRQIASEGTINGIVFYDLSRMDRQIHSFYFDFYQPIVNENPDIKFFLTTQDYEYNPREISMKFLNLMAYIESMDKARRAVDAQIKDLELENRPGSSVPYGYRLINKKLMVQENEAYVVNFIYYMSSWGYSMDTIVNILSDAEIEPPRALKWNKSSIEHILKNEIYLGGKRWNFRTGHKKSYELKCDEIISPTLNYFCQLAKSIKKSVRKMDSPFLLNGLICCNQCKEVMVGQNQSTVKPVGKTYSYLIYRCIRCNWKIEIDDIHAFVINQFQINLSRTFLSNSEFLREKLQQYIKLLQQRLDEKKAFLKLVHTNFELVKTENLESNLKHSFKDVISESELKIEYLFNLYTQALQVHESVDSTVYLSHLAKLAVENLSSVEQKILLHMFVSKIYVGLNSMSTMDEIKVDIEYRVNPVAIVE